MAPSLLLLVDYSKHRADIANASFSDSFSGHDSAASFGCTSLDDKLDTSTRTQSTVSSDRSCSSISTTSDERPICFRVRRSSISGSTFTTTTINTATHTVNHSPVSSASPTVNYGSPTTTSDRPSSTDRFHHSLQELNFTGSNHDKKMKRRHSTTSVDSTADSIDLRLQYASWKRKQESLLSMSAQIATSNTDYYERKRQQRRSGSMPFLASSSAATANNRNHPDSLSRHHSYHGISYHHQEPSQQQQQQQPQHGRPSTTTRQSSSKRRSTMNQSSPRKPPQHSPPRPRRTLLARSASSRRNLVSETPMSLDSSSQHRLRNRMSRSERISSTPANNNSDFVTGSRIRRLDTSSSNHNNSTGLSRSSVHNRASSVHTSRTTTSVHNRTSILPTHKMLGYE
ncbi:expressed unknown protein [Seminavis robusta]|uniref:Uncharacterized protein n=1 Tax=Seminavis robusta TaxID=568900 RepID=A0A9N8DF17_9STRA|nr:expressed unknown protein [Seminavis robusta]|eukprot:Sro64_g036120.1 n/a (399) ;mRNA; f:15153-16349